MTDTSASGNFAAGGASNKPHKPKIPNRTTTCQPVTTLTDDLGVLDLVPLCFRKRQDIRGRPKKSREA